MAPAVAAAATPGKGSCAASACGVYSEAYPTSSGPRAVGAYERKSAKLPTATKDALKATSSGTRKKITDLVTSSDLGAPTSAIPTVQNPDSSLRQSLQAAIASPGSGSMARLVILLLAIIGTTVVAATTAVRRQRTQQR